MALEFRSIARRENLILRALGPQERSGLLALSQPCHFPVGKTIFARGSAGETMLLIDSGRVEIRQPPAPGKRTAMALRGPGDCVGEIALLLGGARRADATAASSVTGRMLHRAEVMDFLISHPANMLGLIADLCRKLQTTTEALADLSMADGGTRLARVLIGAFDRWGQKVAGGRRLSPPVSQSDLGEMAGLSRETVNRQIRAWEEDGILRRDGRALLLADSKRLAVLARG